MTRRSAEVPFTVAWYDAPQVQEICDFDPARPEVALRSHGADVAVRRGSAHPGQNAGRLRRFFARDRPAGETKPIHPLQPS